MQRITRYPLLLKQILHFTLKTHPDQKDLLEALNLSEKLLALVNESAQETENKYKMEEIVGLIDESSLIDQGQRVELIGKTRFMGPREFIYEGVLSKAKSGRKLYAFLFNDLLLFCTPTRGFKMGSADDLSNLSESDNKKILMLYRKVLFF